MPCQEKPFQYTDRFMRKPIKATELVEHHFQTINNVLQTYISNEREFPIDDIERGNIMSAVKDIDFFLRKP